MVGQLGRFFVLWGMVFGLLYGCATAPPTAPLATHLSMAAVIDGVNAYRGDHGLAPLRYQGNLARAASEQAQFQAATGRLSHYGHRGARLEDRLWRSRYRHRIAGENVSFGRQSEAAVVAAWIRSEPHRRMLVHPGITEVGVAAAVGDRGRIYWSLVMADPFYRTPQRNGNVAKVPATW